MHTFHARFERRADPRFDLLAFIERAANFGMCGVNVWVMPPTVGMVADGLASAQQVRECLERHGMGIDIETRGTAPGHLASVLEYGRALGAGQLRTYTVRRETRRFAVEEAVGDILESLSSLEASGMTLLVENHEDLCAADVLEIVERVDHPQVRVLFDYGNSMVFYEQPDRALELLAPYSRSAHLKDHVVIPGEVDATCAPTVLGVPFGRGNLDIPGFTRELMRHGLRRICVENCWAYRTCFRDRCGGGLPGEGFFAYRFPPYDASVCLLNPESHPPDTLAAMERQTLAAGLRWLKTAFSEADIALLREIEINDSGS